MITFFLRFLLSALGLLIIAHYIPGIELSGIGTALIVAVLFGIISITVRPILLLLTLPITLLTFGLFTFVINALLFWFVASFVQNFSVDGFLAAFLGALAYSALNWIIDKLI